MKLVFVRIHKQRAKQLGRALLEQAHASSSSKNLILELQRSGLVTSAEEWRFWEGPSQPVAADGALPVRLFSCREDGSSADLARHIDDAGAPDVIWAEGSDCPPYLGQLFNTCPASLKVVYSKDWKPHKIEALERYDLCLVDDAWQVERVRSVCPTVQCAVWDKLVDYEGTHYPIACEKLYDLCYVAAYRPRKNHELLLYAMAKQNDRHVACVCVGGGSDSYRAHVEALAARLGVSVHFAGEVSKAEVNRYINQSRAGVMCSRLDAAPRAVLEYMAADVPVLVNAELVAGARYVGPRAGLVRSPAEFHLGMAELLDRRGDYAPRAHLLEHFSREQVVAKLVEILGRSFARRTRTYVPSISS